MMPVAEGDEVVRIAPPRPVLRQRHNVMYAQSSVVSARRVLLFANSASIAVTLEHLSSDAQPLTRHPEIPPVGVRPWLILALRFARTIVSLLVDAPTILTCILHSLNLSTNTKGHRNNVATSCITLLLFILHR